MHEQADGSRPPQLDRPGELHGERVAASQQPRQPGQPVPIEDELRRAGLPGLPRTAWLEIDLGALERNARALRRLLDPGARLGVVVKDNGYGHGAVMAARAALAGGAEVLFVAAVDEGCELREAGIGAPIVLLAPVPVGALPDAIARGLQVTVTDPETAAITIDAWRDLQDHLRDRARRRAPDGSPGQDLAIHLEIDSGMTRGGARPEDAAALAGRIGVEPRARLSGLWTHLACGENAASAAEQIRRFEIARAAVGPFVAPGLLAHAAASTGLLCGTCPHYDLVRVGLAFYGAPPAEVLESEKGRGASADLEGALRLVARAVRIADVPPGSAVGYGGDWRAARPSTIATLPLGYADAYQRASWPGAAALLRGRRVPIVGRVSSDAVGVDVTDLAPVGMDEEFVLLGAQGGDAITPSELAAVRRSNEWEVLISLSGRLPRVYRDRGGIAGVATSSTSVRFSRDREPVAVGPDGASAEFSPARRRE